MDNTELLKRLAPCGLCCETCFAFNKSEIKKHSQALAEYLNNFGKHATRLACLLEEPVFNLYPYFKQQLDLFCDLQCEGCRKEACKLFKNCKVRDCVKEHGVEFCFQCPEFPCQKTGFDKNLEFRWKQNQVKMKDVGIEAYFQEVRSAPRYP
jgi:hypothetical protein